MAEAGIGAVTDADGAPVPPRGTLALLPWGNVFEDYLGPIGLTLDDFAERVTGGWIFGYVEALKLAGWRTVIFCVTRHKGGVRRLVHHDTGATILALTTPRIWRTVPVARLRGRVSWLATPLPGFARQLRSCGCRAILCQEYEYGRFDMTVLLGRFLGLPVFATFQGGDRPANRWAAQVRRRTIPMARGFAVGVERERRRLVERYGVPADRVRLIPNPLDLRRWPPQDRGASRAVLGVAPGTELVVSHGRIDRWTKGLDILLEAWRRLVAARPGRALRLLLIGSGADDAWLRAQLADPSLATVTWLSEYILDRQLMARHLAAADLFVLASRQEGQPVAPLEAMAMGLPLVATDANGMAEILGPVAGEVGLLVPRDDPPALAAALGRALDDRAWRLAAGAAARRRVETVFSLPAVGRALGDLLALPART